MSYINNSFKTDREFHSRNERVRKILDCNNNVHYNSSFKLLSYTKKLGDNTQSISTVIDAFNKKNGYTLLTAPTSSGKTFLINEVFAHFDNKTFKNKTFLNVLITPNRIQNIQNGTLYKMIPVVGKTKTFSNYDLKKNNSFSAVSDKAKELLEYIAKLSKNCQINLCLDEAHDLLIEAMDYREETTKYIYELIKAVRKRNGSVVAMTATPNSLIGENFNNYIHFRPETPHKIADHCQFVQYTGQARFWKGLSCYLKKKIEEGYIPFVRYNDIKMTEKICEEFSKNNIISICVDSSQKQSVHALTGNGLETDDYYLNPMVENIIKKAELPKTVKMNGKDENIQVYLTTSMVEVGTNICSIAGEQNKKLLPVFVCQNNRNVKTSSIVQFMNRVRYEVDECVVFIAKKECKDEEYVFLSHEAMITQNFKKANALSNIYVNHMKNLQDFFINRKTTDQIIKHNLLFDDIDDVDTSDNFYKCLFYDNWNRRIMIDTTILRKISYDDFSRQFYYHQDVFSKNISMELGIPVTTTTWDNLNANNNNDDNNNEPGNRTNKKLEMFEKIAESEVLQATAEKYHGIIKETDKFEKDSFADFSSKLYTSEELKEVNNVAVAMNSKEGIHFKELITGGMDTKEAAKIIATGDEKEYRKATDALVKESYIPTLNKIEKRALENFVLNETTITKIRKQLGTITSEKINRICNSGFKSRIKKALCLNLDIDTVLKMMTDCKNFHDMDKKLKEIKYRFLNHQFVCGNREYFTSITAREQYIILANLVQYNQNGNLVQKTLTEDVLNYLASILNQMNGYLRKKTYGAKEVLKLCKNIFQLRNVDGQYRIRAFA